MTYKRLFIFVEGNDDERFFDKLIRPKFNKSYNYIKIVKYANLKECKIKSYIDSINSMGADIIFTKDLDSKACVKYCKEKVIQKFNQLQLNVIVIVVKEIECWYMAGIDDEAGKKLMILDLPNDTNNYYKDNFNRCIPQKYKSRVDFQIELLKFFCFDIAIKKNASFKYFVHKYEPLNV